MRHVGADYRLYLDLTRLNDSERTIALQATAQRRCLPACPDPVQLTLLTVVSPIGNPEEWLLVTKEELVNQLWPEYQGGVADDTVAQLISRLLGPVACLRRGRSHDTLHRPRRRARPGERDVQLQQHR